jgi:hypothetical protein
MNPSRSISAAALLASLLCTTAARADVTSEQVWQGWQDYYTSLGQTIAVGSSENQGDTLVLSDVKFSSVLAEGTSEGTVAEIRLKETGAGSVDVTFSNEIPFKIHTQTAGADPTDAKLVFTQKGLTMNVSGTPESMNYVYAAPELTLSMDEVAVDGTKAPVRMKLTFKGNTGASHMENNSSRTVNTSISADTLDVALTGAEPQGGGTFNLNGQFNGLSGKGSMRVPAGVDTKDINAAMQAGMQIDGEFAYADGNYKIEATGPEGSFNADVAAQVGNLKVKMSKDGIGYGGENGQTTLALSGANMPFPVEATIAQSAFNLEMPVSKSETAAPAAFLVKVIDLKVSDALWNMFDPSLQLPRDPATLVIDLSGAIRPLIDLFDPKQAEALASAVENPAGPKPPFEVSEATINSVQLKVAGAELNGSGKVTLDNTTEAMKPVGSIDLSLTGANGLMDKLVKMGFVPQDQIMGAKMMLGLFAVPTGEDAYSSKIEFKDDGGIYANGQRVQ